MGDDPPSQYPVPCRRAMLLSIGVRCFPNPWVLTIRCRCGRQREAPLPSIARVGLGEHETRTLGDVVRRLRCQECGGRPISIVANHDPLWEGDELLA